MTYGTGTFRFSRIHPGLYSVHTDTISGKMEYVGMVERVCRPMNGQKWRALYGSKTIAFAETRLDAAKSLT